MFVLGRSSFVANVGIEDFYRLQLKIMSNYKPVVMPKPNATSWFRTIPSLITALTLVTTLFVFNSCDDDEDGEPTPTITSFSPGEGEVGTTVTITGTNLANASEVKFNGTTASITSKTATTVVTSVPAGATDGKITLTTPAGSATSVNDFDVVDPIPAPTISGITPMSGMIGDAVTISGSNLEGATVKFNGTTATITVQSGTSIQTSVPEGATDGKITVTTSGGTATSAEDFDVTANPAAPTIVTISPLTAMIGAEVTITGTNLETVTDVEFNGTAATITSQNATTLVTTVPEGATTGKIKLVNPDGEVFSAEDFVVDVEDAAIVLISDFEEEDVATLWKTASDGELLINEIETEGDNSYYHLKAADNNTNHWVGGRYYEIAMDQPLGVTESDMSQVWMTVDVKANTDAVSIGKLVYAVVEAGGPDGRRNFERDFNVDWTEWKTISIPVSKFGFWNGTGMTLAETHMPDITSIWSVALYVKGGSTDVYDISYDNLRFNQGEPEGEVVEGF